MQTILGSTGIIGTELAKALATYTNEIRLVSRHPQKVNEQDELVIANLLDAEETAAAVKGSSIVYLCAGLIYKYSIWKIEWPVIMKNVVDACIQHKAKLVFFDNVYAYGPVAGAMKENTVFQPTSKKGQVRAEIANMILAAIQNGSLTALIARAPEFYGPGKTNSGVNATVFDNIKKGKRIQWLVNDQVKRTMIYTPDAARATALLGNTPTAYNKTWHLPCSNEDINGKKFIALIGAMEGKPMQYTVLSKWMMHLAGLFIPAVKESLELMYQFDRPYDFNSDQFKSAFSDFKITTYQKGIEEILKEIKSNH